MNIKLVCLSDTHSRHENVHIPAGDILVHAGDFTRNGDLIELEQFNQFLGQLPHPHKIVIAGNHDFCCEKLPQLSRRILTNCIYLQDEAVVVRGIKFYGAPWQPWFCHWAFNLPRGEKLRAKWELIPEDTDVLITHGPPQGYMDQDLQQKSVGCEELLARVNIIRPRLHVFGHIHENAGIAKNQYTTFINASICDYYYAPVNPPVVVEFTVDTNPSIVIC